MLAFPLLLFLFSPAPECLWKGDAQFQLLPSKYQQQANTVYIVVE